MESPPPEPVSPAEPKFPRVVKAAGIIWIVVGGLILVVTLALVIDVLVLGHGPDGMVGAAVVFTGPCLALLGGVVLTFGVRTVRGRAGYMLAKGVASIIFGVLLGGPELVSLNPVAACFFLPLFVPGILALVGRADYKAWRNSRKSRAASAADSASR